MSSSPELYLKCTSYQDRLGPYWAMEDPTAVLVLRYDRLPLHGRVYVVYIA